MANDENIPSGPVEVDVVDLPLLGRVLESSAAPALHVFGQIATDENDLPLTLTDQRVAVRGGGVTLGGTMTSVHRMRRIRSGGVQVTRSGQNLPPLPVPLTPPGAGAWRVPDFHLLVNASTPEGGMSFRMDIGETLDLACSAVDITVCGGGTQSHLVGPLYPDIVLNGLVADASVKAISECIESANGCHGEVTFSELVRIPSNAALDVLVPSFAVALKVYAISGTMNGPWLTYSGAAGVGPEGRVEFDAADFYSLTETSLLGAASYVRTDAAPGDRVAKLIWTIRP